MASKKLAIFTKEMDVKSCILGISILLATGLALSAHAGEQDPSDIANAAVQMDPTLVVPPGVNLVELFRLHNASLNTHASLPFMPQGWDTVGWRNETSLGFMSTTPFEGSRAIRQCWGPSPNDFFTSVDMNCEGQNIPPGQGPIGHISIVQIPGTVPLYRCVHKWQGKWRHYDTRSADCEGNAATNNDGPLGYVFL